MDRREQFIDQYVILTSCVFVILGLYGTSLYNYLLFHSLVEGFSIIVGCGIFMVAWNTRGLSDNSYLLFLGVAYLFIAAMDSIHTLAYKGMGVFPGYGSNLPTQLWIAARYLESLSLLAAPFFLVRAVRINLAFFVYAIVFIILLVLIFYWPVFPDCFIEGSGLTPFKKASEYIISGILVISIALLLIKGAELNTSVLKLLIASICFTMGAELAFTFYVHVYGLSNLIGHFFKLFSFYLVYLAIIANCLKKPYSILFRNVKQSEENLRKAHADLEIKVKERTAELSQANKALGAEIVVRRQTEETLRKTNRSLMTLSACNQALVRIDNETEFIKEVCRYLVEIGGYWMAWVGLAESDKNKSISLAGHWGGHEGRLKKLETTWADAAKDCGPAGSVIRTGKPCIVNNMTKDKAFELFRIEALEQGISSSISIPLSSGNETFGVLNIYAEAADAFDSQDTELLCEIAGDLSYGVLMQRTRDDRQKMERELAESEERYRILVENASDIIVLLQDGEVKFVNNKAVEITGFSKEEMMDKSFINWIHRDDQEMVMENYLKRLKGEEAPAVYDARLVDDKGNIMWATIQPAIVIWDDQKATLVFITDITKRKRAEEALLESEKQYRSLISNLQAGIVVYAPDTSIIISNPASNKILELTESQMKGKTASDPIWNFIREDGTVMPPREYPVNLVISTGRELRQYIVGVVKPGVANPIWVLVNAYPLYSSTNELQQIVVTFWDITDLKKMEEALNASLRLNQMMEDADIDDILELGLEEGVRLTDSRIGFLHFVNPDQTTINLQKWSKETMRKCDVGEKESNYPIEEAGIWVDCIHRREPVIHNDYQSLPTKKGLPEGHVPIVRDLAVPVFEQNKMVAVLGVGNKESDYDQFDIDILNQIAGNIWSVIRRKKAEERILSQNEFLESVIESLGHPFYVVDINSHEILMANSIARKNIAGMPSTCYELTHGGNEPCSDPLHICPLQEMKMTGRPVKTEHVHYDSRGNTHYVDVQAYPIFNRQGALVQMIEYCLDITERKLAEKELNRRLEFESFISELSAGFMNISLTDINNEIERSLQRLVEFLGVEWSGIALYSEENNNLIVTYQHSATGSSPEISLVIDQKLPWYFNWMNSGELLVFERLPDDLPDNASAERDFCMKMGIRSILAIPFFFKERLLGNMAFYSLHDYAWPEELVKQLKHVSENFMNILIRKRNEEAVLKSEERFRGLVEAMHEGLVMSDENDFFTYVNDKFCQMLDYTQEEIIGRKIDTFLDEYNKEIILDQAARRREGEEESYEVTWNRRDGQKVLTLVSPTAIFNDSGHYIGSQAVITDITERRIMESKLLQAQKLESLGGLAAGIAHEINTPTQYVGDNTRFLGDAYVDFFKVNFEYETLMKAIKEGEPADEIIARIESVVEEVDLEFLKDEVPVAIEQTLEGVGRISSIVQSMKQFAHPGMDEKSMINLNQAIESTITVTRNEWKYVAEIAVDFDDSLPPVPCIGGELNQVILNLIINASHAIADVAGDGSKNKGKITIATRHIDEWAEIRISDTGVGIPENLRSRIFDPFFTTKDVGKGTGQGLAIAYSVIVEKHGGALEFETKENAGTTFIIRLPLS